MLYYFARLITTHSPSPVCDGSSLPEGAFEFFAFRADDQWSPLQLKMKNIFLRNVTPKPQNKQIQSYTVGVDVLDDPPTIVFCFLNAVEKRYTFVFRGVEDVAPSGFALIQHHTR